MTPDPRPICIDLGHGMGGWTRAFLDAGYRVVGFDIKRFKGYPGESVLQDVRTVDGHRLSRLNPRVIVASMPCQRFSSYNYKTRDPKKGMELIREVVRVVREAAPTFWAMENVRGSVRYISAEIGPPRLRNFPWYVWGDFPGFLIPVSDHFYKGKKGPPREVHVKRGPDAGKTKTTTRWDWSNPYQVAMIPYPLARALAEACLP